MASKPARFGRKLIGYRHDRSPVYSNQLDSEAYGEIVLAKDPPDGICNLCLEIFPELTEDHVPPKSTGNRGRFRYVSFLNYRMDPKSEPLGFSQNGIKYRTICAECNNKVLKKSDDAINELFSPFLRPDTGDYNRQAIVQFRPNLVIRGILGHFVAAKTSHSRSATEDLFAQALQSTHLPISKDLGFYVLPHYLSEIRVIRDLLLVVESTPVVTNIVKVFPFAFIVTSDRIFSELPDWHRYFDIDPDTLVQLEPLLSGPAPPDWPEVSTPEVFGQNAAQSIIGFPA